MALKVKEASQSAKKFVQRGAAAGADYVDGIRGSGEDWERNAEAASENWSAGVQEAITRDGFAKGVRKAGAAKFERKALDVGARRFPEGIRESESDYEEGVAPFLDVLRGLTLTPRRPRGDPSNIERVAEVAAALRRKKVGG